MNSFYRIVALAGVMMCSIGARAQGNVSVDHHTGKAVVTIPLAKVSDRGLSHSVGLVYGSSAVRVDSRASWVGTGWQLDAGGEVRREVRGLPDDYTTTDPTDLRRGWLFNSSATTIGSFAYPADGSTVPGCGTGLANYNFLEGLAYNTDPEPDRFYFHAGGLSGSFVFDNTGTITGVKTTPYQEVQINPIRPTSSDPISSFEIITAGGIKYTFADKELVNKRADRPSTSDPILLRADYQWNKKNLAYTAAWKLTKISSTLGEQINFGYTTHETGSANRAILAVNDTVITNAPVKQVLYTITETTTEKIIASVSTLHQSVVIVRDSGIYETQNNLQVSKVVVNEILRGVTTPLRTYNFNYVAATTTTEIRNTDNRSFLLSLNLVTPCEYPAPYVFNYKGLTIAAAGDVKIPLSTPGSIKKDAWGYYKETGAQHAFPTYYIHPGLSGISRVSLYPIASAPGGEIQVPGADRLGATSVNGLLAKVTYPTGVTDSLEFESHDFMNPITSAVTSGGGVRIKRILTQDLNVANAPVLTRTFQYTGTGGTSSGLVLAMPSFWMLNGYYHYPFTGTVPDRSYAYLSTRTATDQWNRLLLRSETNLDDDFDHVDNAVVYAMVTETSGSGNGKTTYTFDVPYTYGAATDATWNSTYTHLTIPSACPSPGLNTTGYYNALKPLQTNIDYARGLLTKVQVFAEGDTNPVKETVYSYTDKAINGAVIKGLSYQAIPYSSTGYYYLFGAYQLGGNKMKVLASTTERVRDQLNATTYATSVTTYTYGTTHSLVASSTTTNSDNAQYISRYKYARDFGAPQAASSDNQVKMIDALNQQGRYAELIETVSAVIPSGGSEKTVQGTLTYFADAGTDPLNPKVLPQQVFTLDAGAGITSFALSSFSGTGAARTFLKNANYRATTTLRYKANGDLLRTEDRTRQFQSFQPDNLTGQQVLATANAEPEALAYSNFDQATDFSFAITGFSTAETNATGKGNTIGLAGWKSDPARYLSKQVKKKAGAKYTFSAWYQPGVTNGTHSLTVAIRNLANTVLQQQTVTYTVSSATTWYYGETTFDLSAVSDTDVIVQVSFGGSFTATNGETSTLDEVLFAPAGTPVTRTSFHPAFGTLLTVAPDGRMTQYNRDGSGRLRSTQDHDGYVLNTYQYNRWRTATWTGDPTLGIIAPATVYEQTPVVFTASVSCQDYTTIEWKVTSCPGNACDLAAGTYAVGTPTLNYTFPAAGTYLVSFRISSASFGKKEVSYQLLVEPKPLSVAICGNGPAYVNECLTTTSTVHACTTTVPAPVVNTTFTATPSGCPSGTYTYNWETRPMGVLTELWTSVGTGASITLTNDNSYDVRCTVTSSCGYTGQSDYLSVEVERCKSN